MSRFKVDHVLNFDGRGVFVFARHLDSDEFTVTSRSTLAGAPIHEYLDQPRKLKPDGTPDLDYFAFHLVHRDDAGRFLPGETVALEP